MNSSNSRWEVPAMAADVEQESQRTFMASVYRWMFLGLGLTGLIALYTAGNPVLMEGVMQWRMGLILAQLGVVMALSFLAPRLSFGVAAALFLGYSALTGLTFSVLFLVYSTASLGQALLLTAGVYGAMSAYATFTKKSLSSWGTFLFMGLVGVLLASVVQLFWRSEALSFVTACAAVLVFAGLTAYDTQKLRQMHAQASSPGGGNLAVVGALTLYLDFINLFLALVRLLGRRR